MTLSAVGLRMTLGCTVAVLVLAVVESLAGPVVVAAAATLAALGLLTLTALASVVRLAARRTRSGWPGGVQVGIGVVAVLLLAVAGTVAVKAHTASARFEDRAEAFPLPASYRPAPVPRSFTGHRRSAERVVRAWRVPPGADPCADLAAAFAAWAEPPVEESARGDACLVDSEEQAEKAEATVSAHRRTVVLELWLERSSLLP